MTAPSPTPGARWRREDLPEDLAELVATLEPNPTYVVGARWDILHANPSAERIFAPWSRVAREQRNLLWFYCRDPRARDSARSAASTSQSAGCSEPTAFTT